jgi:hypothetical protein
MRRSSFWKFRRGPKPHNSVGPISLRTHPVCYLCGNRWIIRRSCLGYFVVAPCRCCVYRPFDYHWQAEKFLEEW